MGDGIYKIPIFAPLTGQVVDLSEVPDQIYSGRMLGDGVAILPEEGNMFSPVTGYVNMVAEDKHAFGFTTDDGIEVMVHFGIDGKIPDNLAATHAKVNSRVQAGDLIAEFKLDEIKELGINVITPIVICGGLEGKIIRPASGSVKAGAGAVMTIVDEKMEQEQAQEKPAPVEKKEPAPPAEKHSSDVMDFLRDRSNWPKLIGGFVGLTAVLVVIFVAIAMFIGH